MCMFFVPRSAAAVLLFSNFLYLRSKSTRKGWNISWIEIEKLKWMLWVCWDLWVKTMTMALHDVVHLDCPCHCVQVGVCSGLDITLKRGFFEVVCKLNCSLKGMIVSNSTQRCSWIALSNGRTAERAFHTTAALPHAIATLLWRL